MFALLFALSTSAVATDWGDPKPYVIPRLSLGYVSVNGVGSAQVNGGGDLGIRIRDRDVPHWLSTSRISAVGMYGLTSQSIGADFRLGSFFGPDGKVMRIQSGPDIFYNGYGVKGAPDYFLTWSPGLDIRNMAILKIAKEFKIVGEVTPGWAFAPERANPDLPVFTDLLMSAAAVINTGSFRLTAGYQRRYNNAGVQEAIILGAGI